MTKSKIFHRRVFNCDAMGITIWGGVGGKRAFSSRKLWKEIVIAVTVTKMCIPSFWAITSTVEKCLKQAQREQRVNYI